MSCCSYRNSIASVAIWSLTLAVALVGLSERARGAAARPNIVIILADDMGYSDIGCYGGEIHTPTLDRLAANGLRFTQFYNTGRCCPTRASLLTGLYPHQAGIGHMMNDRGYDGYRGDLTRHSVTIAEALKPAGYAAYMVGKWHVTPNQGPNGSKHNWPLQRGFDRFYGTIHGAGSFYDPNSLTRDNTMISPYADPEYRPKEFFYTDAISENAAKFIEQHDSSQPFFMYVAFTAAHWPMHARPKNIAKYQGVYDQGWDTIRAKRYQRMLDAGLIDSNWKLSPRDNRSPKWEDAPLKPWEIRLMEVYAAMVDCMDQGIGKIVDAVQRKGQLDNTLIFFLQDNGGCAEAMGRRGEFLPRPTNTAVLKPMKPDELQPDMIPKVTRDGYPVRQGRGVMAGPADTYLGYGLSWANVSNTPFREYKHWVHEGGISTPLVVHWPAGIPVSRRGKLEDQPGHLIDLMATCVDVAEASYPTQCQGHKITPLEGVSLRPAFHGKALGRENPLFWEHEGNRAIRQGDWKLVAKGKNGPWELYDLKADRSELNDVAKKHPARTKEMAEAWQAWARRAQVLPLVPRRSQRQKK